MWIGRSIAFRWQMARSRARWLGVLASAALGLIVSPVYSAPHRALVLEVDGAIGPAIAGYVTQELGAVRPDDISLIVLRMDTPGGLDTSMREINRAILASSVPVAAYVAPSGARAASAGTYITYACAIAAMAPGTNLGAATPIQLGVPLPPTQPPTPAGGESKRSAGDEKSGNTSSTEPTDTETRKIVNDAIAYIRGLAELNGRNEEWAADAVRSSVSLPATEALKLHVIDVVARDVPDLLRQIDGQTVMVAGKPQRLATAGLEIVTVPPGWRTNLLSIITNPNIAYLLMLLAAYGLIFEMTSPGAVLPGVIGGISLLLALFALNLLPVDYAGAALVLLGIGLMVAEAFIGAFGVIGIGGIVAFVFGSIIMFRPTAPGFGLSSAVVIGATIVTAVFFLLAVAMVLRSRRRPVITGKEALIGATGETTTDWRGEAGRVRVHGEIWLARASHNLSSGTPIKVLGREGLVLIVEPV